MVEESFAATKDKAGAKVLINQGPVPVRYSGVLNVSGWCWGGWGTPGTNSDGSGYLPTIDPNSTGVLCLNMGDNPGEGTPLATALETGIAGDGHEVITVLGSHEILDHLADVGGSGGAQGEDLAEAWRLVVHAAWRPTQRVRKHHQPLIPDSPPRGVCVGGQAE